jgi:predicted metal-dependent hydrolase
MSSTAGTELSGAGKSRRFSAAQTWLPFEALPGSDVLDPGLHGAPSTVANPARSGAPHVPSSLVGDSARRRDRQVPPPGPPAPVFVRHPRARRYVLRVAPYGAVRVTIPRRGSKREAVAFAERQQAWIEKQRRRFEEERRLRLVRGQDDALSGALSPAELRRLREQARRELPARLLELAAQHGLQVTRISVRNQRTRWGSCSRSGHVCLNWRLVQLPPSVRDYVLIHELMHLKRMNHSRAFWKLVAAACPDYKKTRAWLRSQTAR